MSVFFSIFGGKVMDKDCIKLSDDFFIGKGKNMAVYINPINPLQCIKIQIGSMREYDLEMSYRKSRQRRKLPQSSLMTNYYGEVITNLGIGYVFERVIDYDGTTSMSIHDLVQLEMQARKKGILTKQIADTEKELPPVKVCLLKMYEKLFQDRVLLKDDSCENFLIQFNTPATWEIRIIDGFGYRALLNPFVYYIDFLTVRQIKRYWIRLVNAVSSRDYPGLLLKEDVRDLKETPINS